MSYKYEVQSGRGFEIKSESRKWLVKYLNSPNKHLRLLALDSAIMTIRIEGARVYLQNMQSTPHTALDSLRNLERINENNIDNHRRSPEYGTSFFKLYAASIFLIESYVEKMIKQNQTPRATAFTKAGNAFRRQKELVLADLRGAAFNPDLG